jgi:hypothetical protein
MSRSNQLLQPDQKGGKSYSIGIDASITSFGIYCRPINHEEWYGFSLQSTATKIHDSYRVNELCDEAIACFENLRHPVAIACFEDYGPIGRTSGKITARAEICGILKRYFMQVKRCPIIMVPPNSLKNFATTKGNASKEQMLDAANRLGYYPDTHDEADAFFAATLGARVLLGGKIGVSFSRANPV